MTSVALFVAETVKDISTGYGSLVKTGIILLVAIAVFMWWMWRQA